MNARRSVIGVLVIAAAVSCRPDDQRTDSLDPAEAMQTRESLPAEVVAMAKARGESRTLEEVAAEILQGAEAQERTIGPGKSRHINPG